MTSPLDQRFMDVALRLAARALGRTHPNPVVGCVITKDNRIIGKGFHQKAGLPHAEIEALNNTRESPKNATAYVTLEPCAHYGRTPPCALALVNAGLARVVVATKDPNPLVAGNGLKILEEAGIATTCGIREQEAQRQNAPFFTWITKKRPLITLKSAASLDGRIATSKGESQWITSPAARHVAHRLRDSHDAVLVGVGTVLADNPKLTTRFKGGRDPIRLVVDSTLRIPTDAAILSSSPRAPLWIATTNRANAQKMTFLSQLPGVEVITCYENDEGQVDLPGFLATLGAREITSILLEGGGKLTHGLLSRQLVDRASLFFAPMLIGGRQAEGIWEGSGCDSLRSAPRIKEPTVRNVGPDFLIEGPLEYPA